MQSLNSKAVINFYFKKIILVFKVLFLISIVFLLLQKSDIKIIGLTDKSALASAGLNISGVSSGSVSDGESVVVGGSGFGTGDINLLLWDNFEDGTSGVNLNASPKIGAWDLQGASTWSICPQYDTSQYHSGSQSSHGDLGTAHSYSQFTVDLPDATYFYISFW